MESVLSADTNGRIRISSLENNQADLDCLIKNFTNSFSFLCELNTPLYTQEIWDAVCSLPSLDTLHLNDQCECIDYGMAALVISPKKLQLKSIYVYRRRPGSWAYTSRFWRNLCSFTCLESLGVADLDEDNLRMLNLNDTLLPKLPASLKKLELFLVPTITFQGIISNNLWLPKLEHFVFHEISFNIVDKIIADSKESINERSLSLNKVKCIPDSAIIVYSFEVSS